MHPLSREAVAQRKALSEINCKWCNTCKRVRHKDDFHKCAKRADGLQVKCVACSKVRQAEYSRDNRAKLTESHRNWVRRNPEAVQAYALEYRARPESKSRHAARAVASRRTVSGALKNRITARVYRLS